MGRNWTSNVLLSTAVFCAVLLLVSYISYNGKPEGYIKHLAPSGIQAAIRQVVQPSDHFDADAKVEDETPDEDAAPAYPKCLLFDSEPYRNLVNHIRQNILVPPPDESERRKSKPWKYHSQMGQDKFVNSKVFHNRTNGLYIEAGASDGITFSNTLFFEETFGWTGLLVEPDPWSFAKVKALKRNAWILPGCLGSHRFRAQSLTLNTNNASTGGKGIAYIGELGNKHNIWKNNVPNPTTINVTCYPLNLVLEALGWSHIDYFSLDVEGAEAAALHSIDYDRYSFDMIDIECNHCVNGKGGWTGGAAKGMLNKRLYIKQLLFYEGYNETYYKDQDIFYTRITDNNLSNA